MTANVFEPEPITADTLPLGPKRVRTPDCGWLLLSNMDSPITQKAYLAHYSLHLYSPAYEEGASRRLVLSPHIGGVTEGMFFRAHRAIWENIARLEKGEPLGNRVS